MPSTKTSDVAAALSLYYKNRFQTQINGLVVLASLLPVLPGEGKACYWTTEMSGAANATASVEGVARSSSDADQEIEVPATLPWAQYDKVASVTGLAEATTATNINPESIRTVNNDLLAGRLQGQVTRIGLGIASDLYAGDSTLTPPKLAGAAIAIASSGTFAGINPGTYAEWVSAQNTLVTANLSIKLLRELLFTPIYDACGEMPEFVTCSSALYDRVKDLLGDRPLAVQEVTMARGGGLDGEQPRVVKLNAGMNAISVDGVPLVRDRHATANTFYAWNTRYVALRQVMPYWGIMQQGQEAIQEVFRRIAGKANLRLPQAELEGMAARGSGLVPHVRLLGDRGDSTEAMVVAYAQMEWKRRNAFGKLTLV